MLKFRKQNNKFRGGVLEGNPFHYVIENSRGEIIGRIYRQRVGKFMHWCFFPDECTGNDLFFTNGCLKEIREFITGLYSKHKKEVKQGGEF